MQAIARQWRAHVTGLVSRLRDDRARVAVPRGEYTMREHGFGRYELWAEGKPRFTLTVVEVSTYARSKDLKIEGRWPQE